MLNYDEKFSNKLNSRIKGESLLTFPDDYTVIDIETNGLNSAIDDIIELSAIRVREGKIVKTFSKLVKPQRPVGRFISNLTGIKNSMLENEHSIEEVLPDFLEFVGKDTILGHNINFDINFIYDKSIKYFNKAFSNSYVDTLKIARKLKLDCENHKLQTLADYYKIKSGRMHRGLEDCRVTYEVYKCLKTYVLAKMAEFM